MNEEKQKVDGEENVGVGLAFLCPFTAEILKKLEEKTPKNEEET